MRNFINFSTSCVLVVFNSISSLSFEIVFTTKVNFLDNNHIKNKIKPINFAVTPDNWGELHKKIESLSGGEKALAMLYSLMAWNLACKMANEEEVEDE